MEVSRCEILSKQCPESRVFSRLCLICAERRNLVRGRRYSLGPKRICINCDYPGAMVTLFKATFADTRDEKQIVELKRLCQTSEDGSPAPSP